MEGSGAMRSIDNLREYVLTAPSICSTTRAILVGYVDEIEREVKEARDRDYRNGREDAAGAAEFADRLCRASERREDVTLWGVDYMPYPLDADGVPIHVGDVLEWSDGETFRVEGIGGETLFYIGNNNECEWTSIDLKHHHHAPTVEDVLREFALACEDAGNAGPEVERIAVEYAARLMLAGEDA